MLKNIIIEAVTPSVDGGRYPAKRVVGEPCVVEADIFRDGHFVLGAVVLWRQKHERRFSESPMRLVDNDRWRGEFPLAENTRYVFTIEAWTDRFATWLRDFRKKVKAKVPDVDSDRLEGLAVIEETLRVANGEDRHALNDAFERLRQEQDPEEALRIAESGEVTALMARFGIWHRPSRFEPLIEVIADRTRARFGAWYEMFPRSAGTDPTRGSTFGEAEARLQDMRDMGFDVVYLPPIHPIGFTNRKGRNNALKAAPGDPGSPWAIGNEHGGHTAVEPSLGTIEDFDGFVEAARRLGLEIALDFAIQCSPDHPWAKEHPEWFAHRPDGTIKYAENPPKKYQDIYPVEFETTAQESLMQELRSVLLHWIDHGVRIFRVDNPHTKPVIFWRWLIEEIQKEHPDVIFLAEAFTVPKMMKALAKVGFTQSYTYFTWRHTKAELTEYLTELTQTEMADYFRPNFFTNTPDILSPILQTGGRPAFKQRYILAATLSPSYGIYSGFELCENEGFPGTEDYGNSEKYEIKARDWNRPGNIKEIIARVNAIRNENPALQTLTNLRFLETDNDQLLFYCKATPDLGNVLLIVVNLDPHNPHHGTAIVPPDAIGVNPGDSYRVQDLLTGASYVWSERNYVRLDPHVEPAHILRVEERAR